MLFNSSPTNSIPPGYQWKIMTGCPTLFYHLGTANYPSEGRWTQDRISNDEGAQSVRRHVDVNTPLGILVIIKQAFTTNPTFTAGLLTRRRWDPWALHSILIHHIVQPFDTSGQSHFTLGDTYPQEQTKMRTSHRAFVSSMSLAIWCNLLNYFWHLHLLRWVRVMVTFVAGGLARYSGMISHWPTVSSYPLDMNWSGQ